MNEGDRPSVSREERIAAVMHGILDYLDKHPKASDTWRGVELWLRDLPEVPSSEIIELALERLAEQGQIAAHRMAGGTVVYGRGS